MIDNEEHSNKIEINLSDSIGFYQILSIGFDLSIIQLEFSILQNNS